MNNHCKEANQLKTDQLMNKYHKLIKKVDKRVCLNIKDNLPKMLRTMRPN